MFKRLLAVVLTWLLPGAGHLYLGRAKKALYFLVLIESTFFLGLALGGFRIVSFERFPFYSLVFGLNPIASGTVWKFTGHLKISEEILTLELGCLFAAVASLLNVLVMIDAYDIADRSRPRPIAERANPEPEAS